MFLKKIRFAPFLSEFKKLIILLKFIEYKKNFFKKKNFFSKKIFTNHIQALNNHVTISKKIKTLDRIIFIYIKSDRWCQTQNRFQNRIPHKKELQKMWLYFLRGNYDKKL